ncbi:MAG: hypothetical protein E3J71_01850 [Candidatus Stahlbacteria bacterium]|nr:MAG: hypothetical protein E3J71_01850 [Candidatus Stahlbacteria bacterium]
MSILFVLIAYIYNPSDWQHYPRLDEIRNFTADAFNTVYMITNDAIIELDDDSSTPERIFGSAEGLPLEIAFAVYDTDLARVWVVSAKGELYAFTTAVGLARKVFLTTTSSIRRLGINAGYIFLDHGSSVQSINKRSEQPADALPDSTTVWVGSYNPANIRKDYPLLAPWVFLDERMHQIPYSMVFTHRNKAYVSVRGYGYLVFDGLAWRETLRYQSPRASEVHSIFAADSSLYAFGKDGVDQLVVKQKKMLYHPFEWWGTTRNETPSWGVGIMDKLRRTSYEKARLIEGNLFLLERREADVFNVDKKVLSEIRTQSWIYDVDFNKDSLFVATDDGVFLTVIPTGEPKPLHDERSKLVRRDVLAIVRGDHARYFWTGRLLVKQTGEGWEYFTSPGFIPVPQNAVAGRDSLIVLGGNGGLVIYNPETYLQISLTTREGLLSDNVTALLVDGNYLWIATDAGLQRVDLNAVLP